MRYERCTNFICTNEVQVYLCVIAVAVRHAHLDAVLGVVEFDLDVVVRRSPGNIRGFSGNEYNSI